MERKKAFEPGEMITTFTGQAGMVISEEIYAKARSSMKEGRKPGHYFAPGCCQNPDYVIQIPVLFEDGKYDVMRAMHIRRAGDLPGEKKELIRDGVTNFGTFYEFISFNSRNHLVLFKRLFYQD